MAHAFRRVYLHVIFACKHRTCTIAPEWRENLERYISRIAQEDGNHIETIYCMPDHCHILVRLNPSKSFAESIQRIKITSSIWVKEKIGRADFFWQTGYAAFSVSQTHLDRVRGYISNQEMHHAHHSLEHELRGLATFIGEALDERELYRWIHGT